MDDTGRVHILQTTLLAVSLAVLESSFSRLTDQNLVEEVLDELLLQWPRGEQAVKISAEQLGDEVTTARISNDRRMSDPDRRTYPREER